jgi:hypothetical protein
MDAAEQTFEIGSDFEPKTVTINPTGSALVSVNPPVNIASGPASP